MKHWFDQVICFEKYRNTIGDVVFFCSRIYNISDLIIVESTIKYFNLEFIILTYSDYRRDLN